MRYPLARQFYAPPNAGCSAVKSARDNASHHRPKSAGVMRSKPGDRVKPAVELGLGSVGKCTGGKETTRFVATVQRQAETQLPVYYKSMRQAFRAVDTSKTGALTRPSFTRALKQLRLVSDNEPNLEAKVDRLFKICDPSNTGSVTFDRFASVLTERVGLDGFGTAMLMPSMASVGSPDRPPRSAVELSSRTNKSPYAAAQKGLTAKQITRGKTPNKSVQSNKDGYPAKTSMKWKNGYLRKVCHYTR